MKLQHHLGGLEGLDPIEMETRVFVEPWEERIFGIHTAMMALSPQLPLKPVSSTFKTVWTWADLRKGAEAMNPFDYFKYRYYEKWLGGITQFFIDNGYVTEAELAERISDTQAADEADGADAIDDQVIAYLRLGDSPRRDVAHPKFAVGSSGRSVADPSHFSWIALTRPSSVIFLIASSMALRKLSLSSPLRSTQAK